MRYSTQSIKRVCYAIPVILGLMAPAAGAELVPVVSSFSILGDMTQRIGGERVTVHNLVGYDSDAHVYQPSPSDAKTIARARLVVVNGLGFEGWIDRLIKSSGYRGKIVTATAGVRTLKMPHEQGKGHDHGKAHQHKHADEADPHAWQDLKNAVRFVENISKALTEVDPEGKEEYQSRAASYIREITELDSEIRKKLAAIPKERRKVVTSHDAFGYFSRAYDIKFISPSGINTDAEPSAADVARIIRQIQREKIPAVFMENISNTRLLERIQQESGARIGGTLYSDSLSAPGGPASTYLDLMRHNAGMLIQAIGSLQ